MDIAVVATVISVVLSFLGSLYLVHRDRKKDEQKRQQEVEAMVNSKMQPIKETVERFAKHHSEHFDAISELESSQRTMEQRVSDHEKTDLRELDMLGKRLDEIQRDIKLLLRGAREQ